MAEDLHELRYLAGKEPLKALQRVQRHLANEPRDSEALRIAAQAHRLSGQKEMAERAEIAAIDAGRDHLAIAEATRLLDAGEFAEASRIAAEHLASHPDDLAATTISAQCALGLGLPERAIPLLEGVLTRAPSYLLARALLISALAAVDRLRDARAVLDPMVRRMPEAVKFQELAAKIAANQGRYDEAVAASEAVTRLDPGSPENWLNHGDNLRFAGEREAALRAYRKALEIAPDHGRAWWSLADIDAEALDDKDLAAMRRAAGQRATDPDHLCNLQFALGMLEHVRGNHARAFAHFEDGNAMRRAAEPDDHSVVAEQVDRYLAHSPADSMPPPVGPEPGTPTPVFIVGMPRSGSTMVERALGRHSQIEALGELPIVPHLMERLKRDAPGGEVDRVVANLSDPDLQQMGQWYLARASELASGKGATAPFLTDKMHMNWRHLPLILRMLPQARVIDVRRGALDCCWSNYRTLFARGHPAANDLGDIGRFYRDYVRLTDGLRERAPGRIHLVQYEMLVEDFEGELRKMLDALALPFETGLGDFHLSSSPVATASSEQVREPLNRKGIGTWVPYGQWLGPLRDALGELAGD